MNRMFRAGLLALPLLLVAGPAASANDGPGLLGFRSGCNQFGCQGFCLNLFPHINQHGPLVNYGPYDGMWDNYGAGQCGWNGRACGRHGCGRCGGGGFGLLHRGGHGGGCDNGNCGGWGGYARTLFKNVGHRVNPFAGGRPACSTCSQ